MAWVRPLLVTLELMSLSVILATALGISLAFAISCVRRNGAFGKVVHALFLIGMVGCIATPLILHAAAWEATAGKFGWLSFSQTSARTYTGLAGRYTGLMACVWIHGLFGSSIVALATRLGTSRIAPSVLDVGRIDGGPIWLWWRVRLPLARSWIAVSLLATAILAATEMTVVNLYGVRTLADEFYLFHIADPSLTSVLRVLVLPCALGIALFGLVLPRLWRSIDSGSMDHRAMPIEMANEIGWAPRVLGTLYALTISGLLFVFPCYGLLVKIGQQVTIGEDLSGNSIAKFQWTLERAIEVVTRALGEFSAEYQSTFLLAACTALFCVPTAWVLVSLTAARKKLQLGLDLLSLGFFLLPGPMVGLIMVRACSLPILGFSTIYQQTLIPTILALSVRGLPICYWVLRAAYRGIDSRIMDASRLDFSWPSRIWTIERPLVKRALFIAAIASAIFSGGDVPATLPVIPPGVVTVGTRLFALLHSGARYQEAALAFWYLIFVLASAILLAGFVQKRQLRQ